MLLQNIKIDLKFVFETNLDLTMAFNFINNLEMGLDKVEIKQRPRYVFSPLNAGRNMPLPRMLGFLREQLNMINRKISNNTLISVQIHKILGLP